MASATSSIPRFLLPQSGLIWRRAVSVPAPAPSRASAASNPRRIFLRLASSSSGKQPASGPRVLAKPERFNPPSHGSRLPKKTPPRHYGGDLSAAEATAQAAREYPGMPPPKHTAAHWFLHNRWIHVVITVGTLTGLAIYTFVLSFQHTSPFADMLPPASEYFTSPFTAFPTLAEVVRLHEAHKTARISEKRQRNVEDVAKRAAYRRAHGLPEEMGLFGAKLAPVPPVAVDAAGVDGRGEKAVEVGVVEGFSGGSGEVGRLSEQEKQEVAGKARAKWFGIF